jgi:hypothetical protein
VSAEARFSLPITKRFTPGGGTEDLAADFNRDLNSTIFSDLRLVEAAFRLPAGSATFGSSMVEFTQHIQIYTVQAAYGLADRLSIGVRIPYWTQNIQVQTALDTRTATVGINPAVPGGVAPLQVPGTRPATTEEGFPGLGLIPLYPQAASKRPFIPRKGILHAGLIIISRRPFPAKPTLMFDRQQMPIAFRR